MNWYTTASQPIRDERDLMQIEQVIDGHTPINVKIRQVPRLIASLRRAWAFNRELQQELRELRKSRAAAA